MSSKDSNLKKISNPPFKSFIDYRIGDYNTFRKVMFSQIRKNALLGGAIVPRSDKRDYGAALVDMWAYLSDILTYYQERIASESFLRTSRLEESVIELLYLVDYLPQRGRSASTLVRFVANEKNVPLSPTSPRPPPQLAPPRSTEVSVVIPRGFKIRSVPAKGQEPIIFETDESIVIAPDHNLMKLDGWRTSYKIERGTTQLFLDKIYPELNVGDLVMISDDKNIDVVRIAKKVDKDGKSQITWTEDKALDSNYNLSKTKIQKFVQIVRPFGYDAPPSILSNIGLTLYSKKPSESRDNEEEESNESDNSNNNDESRVSVTERLVQIVDVSDRAIASATSDKDGKVTFRGLIPGTYRFLIARSRLLKDESLLYPNITTISTNRIQLIPGYESWFEAELEFGGEAIQKFANLLSPLTQLVQGNPLPEKGTNLAITNPFLTGFLEVITKDPQVDTRPGLNLTPKEPFSFDPVNEDILNHEVYLDKVYGNVKQDSFVILSKDDPSNQLYISSHLFKVSRTGQVFHAKYGIGGNASIISLQALDDKENKQKLIFCWDEILEEIKVRENGEEEANEVPPKETEKLIYFLNKDTYSLDPAKDRPRKVENETTIEISDQNQKNVYRIKLNENGKRKATLFKNDNRILDFIVKEEGEEDEDEKDAVAKEKKTNLYASKIESEFYKIRNTLIFTNPAMEIGVDPRYASQDKTDEYAGNIAIEGMYTGLKSGMYLGIADNTSIIQGKVVDSNLNPLEGYRVTAYRVQNNQGSTTTSSSFSSFSFVAPPIEVASKQTDAKGSFTFDDLRSDNYLLSLSLPLERYWWIFVDHIFEEEERGDENGNHHSHDDNGQEKEKREIINALLSLKNNNKESDSDSSSSPASSSPSPTSESNGDDKDNPQEDKGKDHGYSSLEVAKHHVDAIPKIITLITSKEGKSKPPYLESKFDAYITDINDVILEIKDTINNRILHLIDTGSGESSEASSLLNKSLADALKILEEDLKPKVDKLKSKAQQMLNQLSNERATTSISFVKEFTKKTILRTISIIEEALIIVKESLQSPFRATIYQQNERLLGVTKLLHIQSDTATNITLSFDIRDKVTYVESTLQHSKFQVSKISGAPTFSEGKTHLSLNPPLKYRYVKGFAEIYGNIAPASHGETVKDEILGSGDASAIHQEFTFRKGPISYVPSPFSPNGLKSTLKVIVNDIQWQERDDFLNSSPNDQHYITSLNEDGTVKITFGDGIRGSTVPTGIDNIHAQYRVGIGFKGNLQPNAPVVPQENNPAIKSVSIPAGSYGGAEKIISQQKRNYRPHILTLGRAVSLEDYSNLAITFGDISKARAYMIMKDGRETVVLIVARQRGQIATSALQMELQAYLDERRDISIPLQIESFVPVPVDIVVEVKVNDNYRRSKVVSNIETMLGPATLLDNYLNGSNNIEDKGEREEENNVDHRDSSYNGNGSMNQGFSHQYDGLFSFARLNFGQKITLNEVYAIVERIPGVDFVVVRKFNRRDGRNDSATTTAAVQEIINVNYNEILQCENDPLDPIKGTIEVIARGGVEL